MIKRIKESWIKCQQEIRAKRALEKSTPKLIPVLNSSYKFIREIKFDGHQGTRETRSWNHLFLFFESTKLKPFFCYSVGVYGENWEMPPRMICDLCGTVLNAKKTNRRGFIFSSNALEWKCEKCEQRAIEDDIKVTNELLKISKEITTKTIIKYGGPDSWCQDPDQEKIRRAIIDSKA